jgi:hypothetical protein
VVLIISDEPAKRFERPPSLLHSKSVPYKYFIEETNNFCKEATCETNPGIYLNRYISQQKVVLKTDAD